MRRFKGFTLSELMVAVAVLGILSAIVLPMLFRNNPNQSKMMMKKAFYTTSNVVSEMINDARMYPSEELGFNDKTAVTIHGVTYSGDNKFGQLFQNFLNIEADLLTPSATLSHPCTETTAYAWFRTSDGLIWCVQSITDGYQINVDTNGTRNPNCIQGDSSCSDRTRNFDTFSMNLDYYGKISIPDDQTWAKDAVTVNSDFNSD